MKIKLSNEKLVKKLYFQMLDFEKLNLKFQKGKCSKMRCPVHLSIGQESIPTAICNNLIKSD